MKLLEEYESRAEQCRKLVEKADDAHRDAIRKISQTWTRLAKERRAMLEKKRKQKPKG
jgi:hypothetical protein